MSFCFRHVCVPLVFKPGRTDTPALPFPLTLMRAMSPEPLSRAPFQVHLSEPHTYRSKSFAAGRTHALTQLPFLNECGDDSK